MFDDSDTDTLPPSNLEDSELVPGITPEPRPLSQPTTMTYGVLRHSLSRIIGKITHHFQQLVEPSHYTDVIKLDDELNAFVRSLPPHYRSVDRPSPVLAEHTPLTTGSPVRLRRRMENPDRSLDGVLAAFLPIHRFFLITEILFVRITLHVSPASLCLHDLLRRPADLVFYNLDFNSPTATLAAEEAQVGSIPRLAQRLL